MHLPVPGLLRDLSLRHKILLANFLMVLVPVLLIAVLGTLIFAGLRFTGTLRQAELALLWPERGAAMSVSYAVSDLRWQSERGGKKAEKFAEACRLLEQNGVQVVILRRTPADAPPRAKGSGGKPEAQAGNEAEVRAGSGAPPAAPPEPRMQGTLPEETVQSAALLYVSSGANAAEVVRQARRSIGAPDAEGTRWQQGEFAFVHRAHSGCDVYAYGRLPLPAPGQEDAEAEYMKSAVEGLAFFGLLLALVFIIWLGLLLARLISRQVLDPLQALRQAAAEIGRGNLSGRLAVRSQDEVGETCACFDRMRADLLAAREAQERYEQGRRELIVGISHDLSTPLTAIGGYATGLADGIAKTPERRRRYAERITALVAQLSHLVDRLVLLSRLDLGRVAFHLEPLGVHAYLGAWAAERRAAWEA
ncbi:histidine kinase dimerization/phospho-acceptor domain-containing protein [uncultured Selenomonas sp.]|uniref:HAMP domain-containing sensor histidine kinase n=1 Tax=uncultured Selenomonas sp. TaxID=159275 RepID=UPI002582DCDA|nr:histidine kinase dimerization/phospho-acceptor domain-containing protein [uncultured Selenomonas sp.]